jgi:type I restriction enzyme R subunit
MSLNESIVEDAALEWFGELGYAVGHGPHLAPGEPAAERDSFGEVVQFRFARTLTPALSQKEREKDREAIGRLNPDIPEEASACASPLADRRAVVADFATTPTERRLTP